MPNNGKDISPQLVAAAGLNPFILHNSAARAVMFTSHIGQALVIDGIEPRRIITGIESEYGKYTFKIEMPVNAQIIEVIDRYPRTMDNAIKINPETVVIYENVDSKEICVMRIVNFYSMDKQFGFHYQHKPIKNRLVAGEYISAGKVISDSPAVKEDGQYGYGVNANVAFMSVPQIIEDGVVVRRGFLEKLSTNGFESRVASWGSSRYPLNLYGDENNYKPFPDIGDRIRDDGLLFALRSCTRNDAILAPMEMTPASLMKPDFFYDTLIYAEPGAVVTDIIVHHNTNSTNKGTPVGMEVQPEKYRRATSVFYKKILDTYYRIRKHRFNNDSNLELSPDFQQLLVEAHSDSAVVKVGGKEEKVARTYKRATLDDWRVEIHYSYKITPTNGFKVTDCYGGFKLTSF